MSIRNFKLLTDENIHAEVTKFLRTCGFDVLDVRESQLIGSNDDELLKTCVQQERVIVTHDSDFGRLALLAGQSIIGIIFLRPGHVDPHFTINNVQAILDVDPKLAAPFVLVARRHGNRVRLRVRSW